MTFGAVVYESSVPAQDVGRPRTTPPQGISSGAVAMRPENRWQPGPLPPPEHRAAEATSSRALDYAVGVPSGGVPRGSIGST